MCMTPQFLREVLCHHEAMDLYVSKKKKEEEVFLVENTNDV